MGCILPIVGVFCPRFLMFFIWLLTNWFHLAFETRIWPLLGFLFMPFTTLAYLAAMLNNNHSVSGGWVVLLIVAVLFDLGSSSDSASRTRR